MAVGRWLGVLVCAGSGLVLLTVAGQYGDRDLRLLRSDHRAEATVLERTGRQGRVVFTTDDRRTVAAEIDMVAGTRSGDVITVRYHPDDPTWYVADTAAHFWPFLLPAIALAGAVCLGRILWLLPTP